MSVLNLFSLDTSCSLTKGSDFLGFPHWYQYLQGTETPTGGGPLVCSPSLGHINDIWLIVAAVIEILLRVAAIMAVVFVIYGGASYTISQGEPEKLAKARSTLIYAIAGLVLSVMAAALVAFLAGRFNATS